jgi:hypothetical protein
MRRLFATVAVSVIALGASAAPATAAHPVGMCGRGFVLMTIDDTLPLVSDGSPLSVAELEVILQGLDKNDDDLVCVKDLPDTPGSPSYIRNVVDNTASTPG